MFSERDAPLAQLVEQLTLNQRVPGSSPWWCTRRPVGQAVKTPASHAGNGGSIPPRVTREGTDRKSEPDRSRLTRVRRYGNIGKQSKSPKAGTNDVEDPPVPIPNTEVKLNSAENTWRDTAREHRSAPAPEKDRNSPEGEFFFYIPAVAMRQKHRNSGIPWGSLDLDGGNGAGAGSMGTSPWEAPQGQNRCQCL